MSFIARSLPRVARSTISPHSSTPFRYAAITSHKTFATQPSSSTYRGKYTADLSKTFDPSGKDIVSIIKEEHKLVDGLFEQYQKESNPQEKRGIAFNIIKLLSIHGSAEEMSLYPYIQKNLPNGTQMVEHALKEHQQMKNDLYTMDSLEPGSQQFDSTLQRLVKDTQHHVKEEESTILPALQKHCSRQELEDMKKSFLSMKSISPSRPHPSAPNHSPANVAANTTAVPLDAARDIAAGRFTD